MKNFPLLLHATASAWRNLLDKRLKPLGLSQAKWRALIYLSFADKPLTQTELSQRLGIEGASLVGLIDRLEKEGWVDRKFQSHDRRIRVIHLTKKSRSTLIKIQATADQLSKELLDSLPKQALIACENALKAIKEQIDKTNE